MMPWIFFGLYAGCYIALLVTQFDKTQPHVTAKRKALSAMSLGLYAAALVSAIVEGPA